MTGIGRASPGVVAALRELIDAVDLQDTALVDAVMTDDGGPTPADVPVRTARAAR